ncbi:MAG: SagB/ThcOx family dehydrogenase [Pseudolabrys sp.]|nr:SagB/ThcOx family dehydrogenase [Pseudolabrys sp.]MDP2297061.1 SagB/ThcOx family dehydrogenase [Pseudolabrys sp.]
MVPAFNVVRLFSAAVLAASIFAGSAVAQQTIKLPTPKMDGGMPLMEAIAKRQSTRAYADKTLSNETLSNLLWAAFGINRPESSERTAPSWRGSKETDIYVATAEGVRIYEPATHTLRHVMDGDIRADTGRQPYAATAPVVLIYVADRTKMAEAPEQDQTMYAHVDSAFISQNVYLFAAAQGLGTVVLGNVEKAELAKKMNLRGSQILTFTQPVGHPK